MKFVDAKKLHNGDKVRVKETGEVVSVLNIVVKEYFSVDMQNPKKYIEIETISSYGNYEIFRHIEIE